MASFLDEFVGTRKQARPLLTNDGSEQVQRVGRIGYGANVPIGDAAALPQARDRYDELIARLSGHGGSPAYVVNIENDPPELAILKKAKLAFTSVQVAAGGAANASGLVVQGVQGVLTVITAINIFKATAGTISISLWPTLAPGPVILSGLTQSFAFFREARFGVNTTNSTATRVFTKANTPFIGTADLGVGYRRLPVLANTFTPIPISPIVLTSLTAGPAAGAVGQVSVYNETLNEAITVMVDFYERAARIEELQV